MRGGGGGQGTLQGRRGNGLGSEGPPMLAEEICICYVDSGGRAIVDFQHANDKVRAGPLGTDQRKNTLVL